MQVDKTHCARVDSHTVILVVDICTCDHDIRAGPDVEAVSILATSAIASGVIDGHAGDCQAVGIVDTDSLNGRILDVEVRNGRIC